jgi:hypothetical protein
MKMKRELVWIVYIKEIIEAQWGSDSCSKSLARYAREDRVHFTLPITYTISSKKAAY